MKYVIKDRKSGKFYDHGYTLNPERREAASFDDLGEAAAELASISSWEDTDFVIVKLKPKTPLRRPSLQELVKVEKATRVIDGYLDVTVNGKRVMQFDEIDRAEGLAERIRLALVPFFPEAK